MSRNAWIRGIGLLILLLLQDTNAASSGAGRMWTSATYQFQPSSFQWQSGDTVTLPSDAWVGGAMPSDQYGVAVVVARVNGSLKVDLHPWSNKVDGFVCEQSLPGESCDVPWTLSTLGPVKTCVRVVVVEEGIILRYAKQDCAALGGSLVSIQTVDKLDQIRGFIDDTLRSLGPTEAMSTVLSVTTDVTTSDAVTSEVTTVAVTDVDTVSTTLTTAALSAADHRETTVAELNGHPRPSVSSGQNDVTHTPTLSAAKTINSTTVGRQTQDPSATTDTTVTETTTRTPTRSTSATTAIPCICATTRKTARTTPATTTRHRRRYVITPAPDLVKTHKRPPEEPSWKEGDKRPSAIGVGVVAIMLTVGFFIGLLLLDMAALRRDLRTLKRNIRYAFRRMKPRTYADIVKTPPLE